MTRLPAVLEQKLRSFATTLVDQSRARVIVNANQPRAGYWFGSGNLVALRTGELVLVGRYRNRGDSRSGLAAGERGCELAVFRSHDQGQTWTKSLSLSKRDLDQPGRPVVSIEGNCLVVREERVEWYVSCERGGIAYPHGLEDYLKPGCGIWSVDRLQSDRIESFVTARVETLVSSTDPEHLHIKDPRVYRSANGSERWLCCTHPYSWSSSNTMLSERIPGTEPFASSNVAWFPRGTTWDVAIARGTCLLEVPRIGAFQDRQVTLLFYDGGECVRELEPHPSAVRRPRGHSCEELGGLAYFCDGDLGHIQRLSTIGPLFVSPHATGCSRYVDVLAAHERYYVSWQQAQPDHSQPLVLNIVEAEDAHRFLHQAVTEH